MMERKKTRGTYTIKTRLAAHQAAVSDWEYAELAKEMNRWVGVFNAEWGLKLDVLPTIEYRAIRNAYGTYSARRGALGLPDVVALNTDTLDRPTAHIIRTLGHELLHLWQQYHGTPTKQRNYHNDEYIARAASCGLVIDHRGCTAGHTEQFAALIAKYGIRLPSITPDVGGVAVAPTGGIEPLLKGAAVARGAGSKMKKWTCGCTIVRCAVDLDATCVKCDNPFAKEGE